MPSATISTDLQPICYKVKRKDGNGPEVYVLGSVHSCVNSFHRTTFAALLEKIKPGKIYFELKEASTKFNDFLIKAQKKSKDPERLVERGQVFGMLGPAGTEYYIFAAAQRLGIKNFYGLESLNDQVSLLMTNMPYVGRYLPRGVLHTTQRVAQSLPWPLVASITMPFKIALLPAYALIEGISSLTTEAALTKTVRVNRLITSYNNELKILTVGDLGGYGDPRYFDAECGLQIRNKNWCQDVIFPELAGEPVKKSRAQPVTVESIIYAENANNESLSGSLYVFGAGHLKDIEKKGVIDLIEAAQNKLGEPIYEVEAVDLLEYVKEYIERLPEELLNQGMHGGDTSPARYAVNMKMTDLFINLLKKEGFDAHFLSPQYYFDEEDLIKIAEHFPENNKKIEWLLRTNGPESFISILKQKQRKLLLSENLPGEGNSFSTKLCDAQNDISIESLSHRSDSLESLGQIKEFYENLYSENTTRSSCSI